MKPHSSQAMKPTALTTSPFKNLATVFPIILRRVSPMPIGRNPGFLFNGIRRQASKDSNESSSWDSEHSVLVSFAIEEHRSDGSVPKQFDVKIRRHPSPSKLKGPAPPLVFSADCRIISESISSNRTGCNRTGVSVKRTSLGVACNGVFLLTSCRQAGESRFACCRITVWLLRWCYLLTSFRWIVSKFLWLTLFS